MHGHSSHPRLGRLVEALLVPMRVARFRLNRAVKRSGVALPPFNVLRSLCTGLQTPTGVVTEGSHDYLPCRLHLRIHQRRNAGDGTVENVRVLDNLEATSPTIERLHGVPLGSLR